MGNFINPKKIKGQDKLNRIKDLMGKMNTLTESKTFSELELIKRGPNGIVYGIIRENHDYFIKTTEKKGGTFLAEDFNYVGGIQNKYDERYKTYSEAIRQLNMKFEMLNESFGIETGNNIFESDGVPTANASGGIKSGGMGFVMENPDDDHPDQNCWEAHEKNGKDHDEWKAEQKEDPADVKIEEPDGEQLLDEEGEVEEQKKVIKVDAPTPPPAPVEDEVSVDEFGGEEIGGEEFEGEEEIEVDVEGGDEDNPTKKIQKLTGKVTQQMRELEEPDPELDKYVINSVISAIEWEAMSEEDVEDIIAKIEGDEEEEGEEVDIEIGAEEGGEEVEIGVEDELAESEEKEGEEEEKEGDEKEDEGDEDVDDEDKEEKEKHYEGDEKDLEDEIKKLEKDLARAKKKKEEYKNESRTYSKKQLMESFLKKNANLALKKVLKENQAICEECLGGGCPSCDGNEEEWASLGEDFNVTNQTAELAGDDVHVVPEQEMDVVTAIATGQDYLGATGDLDRDGDDIPNRLDVDNNDDGELDHTMDSDDGYVEISLDSLMGNNPAPAEPTTKPGTKPTTRPGKGKPRWKKIPRPNVDPRPKAGIKKTSYVRRGMYR